MVHEHVDNGGSRVDMLQAASTDRNVAGDISLVSDNEQTVKEGCLRHKICALATIK